MVMYAMSEILLVFGIFTFLEACSWWSEKEEFAPPWSPHSCLLVLLLLALKTFEQEEAFA